MTAITTYYPSGGHKINVDAETGARYWSVEGKNLQFTWFEVAPGSIFNEHRHDSEQVTYVLEGELFFKVDNKTYQLSGGDSIVIPGNTAHAVWTEKLPAVAVDAWSPVNEKYHSKQ